MHIVGDQPVLEPLSFSGNAASYVTSENQASLRRKAPCLLCDTDFNLPDDFGNLSGHLQDQHHLLINKIQEIADLPKYLCFIFNFLIILI